MLKETELGWVSGHPTEDGTYLFRGVLAPMVGSSGDAYEIPCGLIHWYTEDTKSAVPYPHPVGFIVFTHGAHRATPRVTTQYVLPEEIAGEFAKIGNNELGLILYWQDRDGGVH